MKVPLSNMERKVERMEWASYLDIDAALGAGIIPDDNANPEKQPGNPPPAEDSVDGHSMPDVYGKAVQQYISLRKAADRQNFNADSVRTWRGLLTLLALQEYLHLPLDWERVDMREEMSAAPNLFFSALKHPPARKNMSLFPQNADWQWNGAEFYVLRWTQPGKNPMDLLLYSPISLVYPVADWRKIFTYIAREDRRVARFFDSDTGSFRSLIGSRGPVLQDDESRMVCFWLKKCWNTSTTSRGTAKRTNFVTTMTTKARGTRLLPPD